MHPKPTRTIWLASAALALSAMAAAQGPSQPQSDLEPSPLEAVAARSSASEEWSKSIGQIEGPYAKATFTALSLVDRASGERMRGVRIDLAHLVSHPVCDYKNIAWNIMCRRSNAAVFIEEDKLEAVRAGVAHGAASLRPWEFTSSYGRGIILCGYDFPELQPNELAGALGPAIAELNRALR